MPSLGSWPHRLLPGRCLPCSDGALNLLSVPKDGEGEQPFSAPSALSAGTGDYFLWAWEMGAAHQRGLWVSPLLPPQSPRSSVSSGRKPLLTSRVLRIPLFFRIQQNVGLFFVIYFRNL